MAFVQVDPFGGLVLWVGLDNFTSCSTAKSIARSAVFTLIFTVVTTVVTLADRRSARLRQRFRDPRGGISRA